jgi:type III secretion protein Q
MRIHQLSKAEGQLLQKIGMGVGVQSDDSALLLTYQPTGHDAHRIDEANARVDANVGLQLSMTVQGHPLRLWFSQSQWRAWVEPVLAVPDWQSVPSELRETLATWTCCTIGASCEEQGLAWPETGTIAVAPAPAASNWHLSVEQEERRLDMDIVEAPLDWLHALADSLSPLDAPLATPSAQFPVPLIAGWSRLHATQLTQLRSGAALVLHHAYQVAEGELGLLFNSSRATLRSADNGTFIIEDILENFDDWLDLSPDEAETHHVAAEREAAASDTDAASDPTPTVARSLAADTLMTVTAEVATLEATLHQLANLKVGDILPGPARANDRVTLKVGSRAFALGSLLDIDGHLAVRVEQLL